MYPAPGYLPPLAKNSIKAQVRIVPGLGLGSHIWFSKPLILTLMRASGNLGGSWIKPVINEYEWKYAVTIILPE